LRPKILNVIHNFNAGPSILPKQVFTQASEAIIEYNNTGLSILEIGHRTPIFEEVMKEARSLVRELMDLDDQHEVLFLHGGASTQFMQVPMNLLNEKDTAAYADTGIWSSKAIKEAKLFGNVDIACTSKDDNYSFIPKDFAIPNDAKYFHITTNNTIYGTQWQKMPSVSIPFIADMSSDILSRQIDFNAFDLIYAGAQKNMGCAGVNLVIVKNSGLLGKVKKPIPTIMDYRNHIREGSMLNTPPVFAVYVSMLTLRWLKQMGGITEIEKLNIKKSDALYEEIDRNPLFKGTVAVEDRSRMNVCFTAINKDVESSFLEFARNNGIVGIKGHRTSGGFRASLYNALPMDSVQVLINLMRSFTAKAG
jgi:phosphoserine aminotransferase